MKMQSYLLIIFCISIIGYASLNTYEISMYKGKELHIGVVGKSPSIREKNIRFNEITLDELVNNKDKAKKFNALLIMENHLSEAANIKYASLFLKSGIPFFFEKSKARHLPFIDHSMTYEEYSKRIDDEEHYITGILGEGSSFKGWDFMYLVKDNKFDKKSVKGIYSTLFSELEKLQVN